MAANSKERGSDDGLDDVVVVVWKGNGAGSGQDRV